MLATINATSLNVRSSPGSRGTVLGVLPSGAVVDVLSDSADLAETWAEIRYRGQTAFVYGAYLQPVQWTQPLSGIVNTPRLNVRAAADLEAAVVGRLRKGNKVEIESVQGPWGQIRFNGSRAFVHTDYIQKIPPLADADSPPEAGDAQPGQDMPRAEPMGSSVEACLAPDRLLEVAGNAKTRKVVSTWNRFGGVLQELCAAKQIDPAIAVAVLCVESSGKGFEQSNQNRMIIRFENHKFWRYWGKHHPGVFQQHFRYNQSKVWTGHAWCADGENWLNFHGNQAREWQVFEFAQQLDRDAARLSISMGAPQIMGFHYRRIGYESVNAMFDAFARDPGAQIRGLFDFFSNGMVADLRSMDFEGFAGAYNGSGQKEKYGRWINEHYQAFKAI